MTKYATTILKVAIHRESENPVFGEGNTYVGIDDEAAGPFIIIEQDSDGSGSVGSSTIRTDYEEFLAIAEAAKMLMHQLYIEKAEADVGIINTAGDAIDGDY
tara:strand:+ start:1369 stop:1674 length:306 start_codon:yes stop_codon:yes gene_type:complete